MPLEEEEETGRHDVRHQQEGRGIHQHQPMWVRVDRSILFCPILVVHLGLYRVQVFYSGSNRFHRVDSGLNLGSDVDSVTDMDLDSNSNSDSATNMDID
ncbi:hypothetical protein CFP56_027344 [Quercus suber]|uniref:Uncharacterized protein n=1 Tax=Quercus suber TaxID=58331 RepID=A0AAW0LY44_QUESU